MMSSVLIRRRSLWSAGLLCALGACASADDGRLTDRPVIIGKQAGDAATPARDAGRDSSQPPSNQPDAAADRDAQVDESDGGALTECDVRLELPECERPNALSVCADGNCIVARCDGDFVDCDGDADNGCETTLDSVDNCGLCKADCRFNNAQASCAAGACALASCQTGYDDCDMISDNGCETPLDSANHCGDCTTTCDDPAGGVAGCVAGKCGVGRCNAGLGDCNGELGDGCEQSLNDLTHCGECNRPCAPEHATGDCTSGVCQVGACDGGWVDCNGRPEDGCETADSAAASCCSPGTADCDGNEASGCEADFSDARTCGGCSNDCLALPHVADAQCTGGSCEGLVCDTGWKDCDGVPDNGCERNIHSLSDCGDCDQVCAPSHGSASCAGGSCTLTGCDNGFDDCNDNPSDGCEASLSEPQTCGTCGNTCPGQATCVNGTCSCTTSDDCSGGQECCDGVCADTRGACFPWPCIPGTDTGGKKIHCGGCGVACGLFCCL